MRTSTRVALNAMSRWLGLTVSVVVGIVIVPIMLGQFGKAGYGLVGVCSALLALRVMIDFGLQAAVTRELAVASASGERQHYDNLVSSAFAVYLLIGVVTALSCVLLAPNIASALKVPDVLHDQGTFLIRFYVGPTFFLVFVTAPMASVLASNDRFDLANYIEAATQILRAVGVILVLTMTPWGLAGWAIVEVLASSIHFILVTLAAHQVRPSLRIRLRRARFRTLPLHTSARTFVLVVADQFSFTSDNFVLSAFLGPAGVGLYEPARLLSRRLRPVVDAIKDQLHPLATRRFTEGQTGHLEAILIQGTKYRLLLGIAVCVGIGVYAPHLAYVWLGGQLAPEELRTVALVMTLWAATDLCTYAGGSQWPVLFGMKKFGFLIRLSLPLAILNLFASVFLVGFTNLGVIGVVIPSLCMESLRVCITFAYCCRQLKLSVWKYFRKSYLRPLMVFIVLIFIAEATRRILNPNSIELLVKCAIICALTWILLCWMIGLEPEDRKRIRELLQGPDRRTTSLGAACPVE